MDMHFFLPPNNVSRSFYYKKFTVLSILDIVGQYVFESSCTFIKMSKFKLKHHDNLQIISLYGLGWPVNAIVKWLAEKVIDVTWDAVKKVIRKHQQGKIRYEHLDTVHLPSFKTITDSDIYKSC